MLSYRDSRITRVLLVSFFVLLAGYAYYEIHGLVRGPVLQTTQELIETSEPLITIEGSTRRIANLLMNGNPIPVTEEGTFAERYVAAPGYNRLVLTASDRYGNAVERVVEIVYSPTSSSGVTE
jgi:hypothetical protein